MATIENARTGIRPKEFHFPLSVDWVGGRRVSAHVAGKPAIDVTPPPEFHGTEPTVWSPEDLFVAAAASCLAVTFTGLAERAKLAFTALTVAGDGVAGMRHDGRFGFTALTLRLDVESDQPDEAHRLAEKAEQTCLVSASLDLPIETTIQVTRPLED